MGWKRLSTSYPFATKWLHLRQDRVERNGEEITFTYAESPGAVVVVPVTSGGEVVLIKQYRYTVDDILVELPAGGMHDAEDRTPEAVALNELREEIGAEADRIEEIGWF